jgi:glycine/D-amino acid oxidase-like deaminating enzyme
MTATGPVWAEGVAAPAPAPREAGTSADVCVVGLGAAGLSAVLALRARGLDVVGLDAGVIGDGASGRNGGFLLAGLAAFHHDAAAALGRERATALYRLTLAELDAIAAATPDAVRRTGSVRVGVSPEEDTDCTQQLAAMQADGLPAEPYEGPEGRGLRFPADAALQPVRRCARLAEAALAAGARLHTGTRALDLGRGRVEVRHGTVRCGAVVVCVDGRLEGLLPELRGRVRTARAQMLATAPTDEVRIAGPVYARWGWDYWQQLPDGRVVLGGCRDVGGDGEWTKDDSPTASVQAGLERLLRERIGVSAPITHRWGGLIAFTDGVLPVVAEVRPGVVAAGAYKGTGNVLGPICGRAAATLAVGDEDPALPLLAG